jgi:hypothetical protein
MTTPKTQQFTKKKTRDAVHSPGRNVLPPRNSSSYPCCSHAACATTQRASADRPSGLLRRKDDPGRYSGRRTMYQRKYYATIRTWVGKEEGGGLTWLVQTLLKVTKAKVCASMVVGRSFFARTKGMRTHERRSWGRKAMDSMRSWGFVEVEVERKGSAEAR